MTMLWRRPDANLRDQHVRRAHRNDRDGFSESNFRSRILGLSVSHSDSLARILGFVFSDSDSRIWILTLALGLAFLNLDSRTRLLGVEFSDSHAWPQILKLGLSDSKSSTRILGFRSSD